MALHRRCTSVRFSNPPNRIPALDGRPRVPAQGMRAAGRSVSRWYQISHAIQVRRFTWATRIPGSGQR